MLIIKGYRLIRKGDEPGPYLRLIRSLINCNFDAYYLNQNYDIIQNGKYVYYFYEDNKVIIDLKGFDKTEIDYVKGFAEILDKTIGGNIFNSLDFILQFDDYKIYNINTVMDFYDNFEENIRKRKEEFTKILQN